MKFEAGMGLTFCMEQSIFGIIADMDMLQAEGKINYTFQHV